MHFEIEELNPSDWPQMAAIYLDGIQTKLATFQTEIPTWEQWDKNHSPLCRLAAKNGETVLGWAALSPVSSRSVYSGVVEVSIYVGGQYKHQGVGLSLMTELIRKSEEAGFWTLQSSIIRENSASQALHAKCGFRTIGIREKIGRMDNGKWHDTVLMERRSKKTGID
ncbi:MAG: N-acetyltransferase family protein [Clostridiaceae bacterium]|nr:N-acetyltransferase family protein [Clostridiaceae bacterium]